MMWWEQKEDVHGTLSTFVNNLGINQSYVSDLAYLHLMLYDPSQVYGCEGENILDGLRNKLPKDRPKWNMIESIIDTVIALVATNKLRVKFLTQGGTLSERQMAVRESDFIAGVFWGCNAFEEAQKAFMDACWYGNGYVKFYEERGTIRCERIFPTEIKVDELDGEYGSPRSMHHVKTVSRSYLKSLYPAKRTDIESADLLETRNLLRTRHTDPVSYCESWHLPSVKGSGDGRHVVWCSACVLDDEDWEEDSFPISIIRYNTRPRGYVAKGLSEKLRATQREVSKFLDKIHRHLNLAATKTFLHKGSKITKGALNNKELGIVEWAGRIPPEIKVIAAIAPEYYVHLEKLYLRGFEIAGISQMSATAEHPSGVSSGKAMRTLSDQQSKRFMPLFQAWEQLHVDMGMQALNVLSGNNSLKVDARPERGGKVYSVNAKEIKINTRTYRTRAYAVNELADTPAGRYEGLAEAIGMDPRFQSVAMQLVDNPDLRAYNNRFTAPERLTDFIISKILTGANEEDIPEPDPYMELPKMVGIMKLSVQGAVVDGEKPESIQRLRTWIDEAIAMVKALSPPPAPPSPPAPMGMPAPPLGSGPPPGPRGRD